MRITNCHGRTDPSMSDVDLGAENSIPVGF